MAGGLILAEWRTLPGSAPCPGCDRGTILSGARALVYRRGPRGTDRLIGQNFHGFACLARRADQCAWEEPDRGSDRADAYREVERWAADQDRRRRQTPVG